MHRTRHRPAPRGTGAPRPAAGRCSGRTGRRADGSRPTRRRGRPRPGAGGVEGRPPRGDQPGRRRRGRHVPWAGPTRPAAGRAAGRARPGLRAPRRVPGQHSVGPPRRRGTGRPAAVAPRAVAGRRARRRRGLGLARRALRGPHRGRRPAGVLHPRRGLPRGRGRDPDRGAGGTRAVGGRPRPDRTAARGVDRPGARRAPRLREPARRSGGCSGTGRSPSRCRWR